MNADRLGEVAARRRRRQQRSNGETHFVAVRSFDSRVPVAMPVRAIGGRYTGEDVYRAVADIYGSRSPPLRLILHGRLVLPSDTFNTSELPTFHAVPAMGGPPGMPWWDRVLGWVWWEGIQLVRAEG